MDRPARPTQPVTAFENAPTCIQRLFRPGITATDRPLKPELAENAAFDGADLHFIGANRQ